MAPSERKSRTSPPGWRCGRSCSCPPSSAAPSGPVVLVSPGPGAADTCRPVRGGIAGRGAATVLARWPWGGRLAVDLDDQLVAVVLGPRAVALPFLSARWVEK